MLKTEVKSITVIGKRWFEKVNGNTYHTAQIMVNGQTVGNIPFSYGYDRMYLQNATVWLSANGYIDLGDYPSGAYKPLWQYCEDNKIHLEYWAIDVPRKKDL